MLSHTTVKLILAALDADVKVTKEDKDRVVNAMLSNSIPDSEKMITAKEVCEMLNITRRTLSNYVTSGYIHQTNYSERKIRFNKQEIIDFATNGIKE